MLTSARTRTYLAVDLETFHDAIHFSAVAARLVVCDWALGATDNPLVVELWPGAVPDETGDLGAEITRPSPELDRKQVEVTESTRLVTNVSRPTITIYRPPKDKDAGTAVLICPGAVTGTSTGNLKARRWLPG